jgi:hypothetical protein
LNHETGARGGFDVAKSLPWPAVGGQGVRVSVQFWLEETHDRFGHGVVETLPYGADGRSSTDLSIRSV